MRGAHADRAPYGEPRRATLADRDAIRALIERSARGLGASEYTAEEIEGALRGTFGVDSQLVRDGTYYVVEVGGDLGCGGWSFRRTLFGGDAREERDDAELDPKTDAAKIRAFFVDPDHARKGIARAILDRCESDARVRGFTRCELMATLSGLPFYSAAGYTAGEAIDHAIESGLSITLVPMRKALSVRTASPEA